MKFCFDPLDFDIKQGSNVIVETARGVEFGTVVGDMKEVEDDKVIQPLKPVLRVATEKDKKNVCYHVEELTRAALREMKGFTVVKNDRCKYFRLPDEIPVFTSMNNYTNIPLRVIGAETF